ncbi:hypothetical protein ACHAWF_012639 [Thalassiosira exigua]
MRGDNPGTQSVLLLLLATSSLPLAATLSLPSANRHRFRPLARPLPLTATRGGRDLDGRDAIPAAATATRSVDDDDVAPSAPAILPAREPLPSFLRSVDDDGDADRHSFSMLTWNVLLPNSRDNWWCHKQYAPHVPMDKRRWEHRKKLIEGRLRASDADVVCVQEADGKTFDDDFGFMADAGYDVVLHRKFRFRCATFYKRDQFALDNEAHKDRTLVTALRRTREGHEHDRILHVVNCHLSGGAAPERRLRQVHDGLDQVRKWKSALERTLSQRKKGKRPSPRLVTEAERSLREYVTAGVVVCGDFNSDGNTAVRKLLVEGSVDPEWREPQYPELQLTSKRKEQTFGTFRDAAELAYGGNVCDGDYGESHPLGESARPATYVVPNLASLLLMPIGEEERPPRTEFGMQVARGLAEALNLNDFCESELEKAFELVDHDGNGSIDRDEIKSLLESAYVATYGRQIEQERNNFYHGFGKDRAVGGLTKDQFIMRLKALQQDSEGERKAFGLSRGLDLQKLTEAEMELAFRQIDLDGNGLLDEDEFQTLLETVYVAINGDDIKRHRTEFFVGFHEAGGPGSDSAEELTRDQFAERLRALHQELEGGRSGSELAEVRTEADAERMIERFTPLLRFALDKAFDSLSGNGNNLTREEVEGFLIKTNGELGRGGTYRHTSAVFEKRAELTRRDWYGVFARELAEGKWWQVAYDLEACGFDVRSESGADSGVGDRFYQGWLDYVYFRGLQCTGVQDVLTGAERERVYCDGDALPNEWHPSDHLPVAAVFSWN